MPSTTRADAGLRLVTAKDFYVLTVIALMAGVARTGSPRVRTLVASAVAGAAHRLSRRKRRGSEAALTRLFGARLGARRREMIVRRAFQELWLDVFSLLPLRGIAPARLIGAEHLARARAEGRGAILWISNNAAGMSTLKRTLHAHGFPVHKVHAADHLGGFRADRDAFTRVQGRLITPFFDRHERAIIAGTVNVTRDSLAFGRDLAGILEKNGVVCVSADAPLGRRFVELPFLGITGAFPTGIVSLARMTGAPLLPTFCLGGPRGTERVVVEAPIPVAAALDRDRGVRDVLAHWVARMEHHTRRHPSRYLNWHILGA